MKQSWNSLLVASAVAVSAASLGAIGIDRQGQQSQSQQSQQTGQTGQSQQSEDQSTQPGGQGRDEAAARQELVLAKQSLMDLTKLPEASQLQGDARTGVIQIINSFNSLVTADTNWYERYQDVQQQLTRVLGSDTSTGGSASSGTGTSGSAEAGSVGTSGSGASANVPDAVRGKLIEFRQHVTAFGKAAGAPENGAPAGSGSSAGSVSGTSGSSTSGSSMSGSAGSQGTTGSSSSQQGTTGSSSTQGTTGSSAQGASGVTSASGETFQQHIDAISDLVQQALSGSPSPSTGSTSTSTSGTTGTSGTGTTSGTSGTTGSQSASGMSSAPVPVDRATLEQIQSHLQRLRQLARQRGIQ